MALEFLKGLDSTASRIITIVTLLTLIGGGIWSFFDWKANLVYKSPYNAEIAKLATKVDVSIKLNDLEIEIVNVTIMGYEDQLVELQFLIESGEATAMDKVKHQNILNRLASLKDQLGRLEDQAVELQRAASLIKGDMPKEHTE